MVKKNKTYWDKKLIGNGGVINNYVKLRDSELTTDGDRTENGKPIARCITCDKLASGHNLHAGHYITRARKATAYDLHNVHAQCSYCNKWRNGESAIYKMKIVDRYGEEELIRLENQMLGGASWTLQELEELHSEMKEKIREYM